MEVVINQYVDKGDRKSKKCIVRSFSFLCEIGKIILVRKVKMGWQLEY